MKLHKNQIRIKEDTTCILYRVWSVESTAHKKCRSLAEYSRKHISEIENANIVILDIIVNCETK